MNKPLFDFINSIKDQQTHRFFMPGHKGELAGYLKQVAPFDITEIQGADYLYQANGIIAQVEQKAREVFQTGSSVISVGGSSLSIQSMLCACLQEGDSLLCERNCHSSAVNAMGLLGLVPVWLNNEIQEKTQLAQPITKEQVENKIRLHPEVKAVFITSPNYFGQVADIASIAKVCNKHRVLLLVDNAHGAILHFLKESQHPIQLGADYCCDSLHKTLPALTGTGLLHCKEKGQEKNLKQAMELFASTSPSYLLMLSVEDCLHSLLENDVNEQLENLQEHIKKTNQLVKQIGGTVIEDNFHLRLCICMNALGYNAQELTSELRANKIEPEYVSENFVVLLPGFSTQEKEYLKLNQVLGNLKKKTAKAIIKREFFKTTSVLPLRKALLGEKEEVSLNEAEGRISGQTVSICPPGVAVLLPGDLIEEQTVQQLKNSGIFSLKVVK